MDKKTLTMLGVVAIILVCLMVYGQKAQEKLDIQNAREAELAKVDYSYDVYKACVNFVRLNANVPSNVVIDKYEVLQKYHYIEKSGNVYKVELPYNLGDNRDYFYLKATQTGKSDFSITWR